MKRTTVISLICCILLLALLSACSSLSDSAKMEKAVRDITHLPRYSAEAWNNLSIRDRWDLIVAYEREVEKAMELDPANVKPFLDNRGTVGYYSHPERTVYISKILLLDRDSALAAVRHELRHCYQNTKCDELGSHIFYDIEVSSWNNNRKPENYVSSGSEFYTQPLEADAYEWVARTN